MKKRNKSNGEQKMKEIEYIRTEMILAVKYKDKREKRFMAPDLRVELSGEMFKNPKKLKKFLLELGDVWIKKVDDFMKVSKECKK